ncbi:ynein regulatory complex subunit 5 [Anaeramoeba flamelloides]|uniref:Ynein regulatory complex subunit 5 n=1 Tax=Anaeramoeba flamelloides TaxID=1746091 RepID=A0ABQ8XH93_9EUKA|nr:ynein regulatory complex subunit 5 [Anaeramoeba flamelloides]
MDTKLINELIEKISNNDPNLRKVNLWGSSCPKDLLRQIFKHFKMSTVVESVDLSINEIDDDDLEKLGEALEHNSSILHINLSFNKITDRGIKILSNSLKSNLYLKSLDLSGNKIGDNGVKELLNNLKFCVSLLEINVDLNNTTGRGDIIGKLQSYLDDRRKGKARLFGKKTLNKISNRQQTTTETVSVTSGIEGGDTSNTGGKSDILSGFSSNITSDEDQSDTMIKDLSNQIDLVLDDEEELNKQVNKEESEEVGKKGNQKKKKKRTIEEVMKKLDISEDLEINEKEKDIEIEIEIVKVSKKDKEKEKEKVSKKEIEKEIENEKEIEIEIEKEKEMEKKKEQEKEQEKEKEKENQENKESAQMKKFELKRLNMEIDTMKNLIKVVLLAKQEKLPIGINQAIEQIEGIGETGIGTRGRTKKKIEEELHELKDENNLLKELNRLQRKEIKELNSSVINLKDEMKRSEKRVDVLKGCIKILQKNYKTQSETLQKLKK